MRASCSGVGMTFSLLNKGLDRIPLLKRLRGEAIDQEVLEGFDRALELLRVAGMGRVVEDLAEVHPGLHDRLLDRLWSLAQTGIEPAQGAPVHLPSARVHAGVCLDLVVEGPEEDPQWSVDREPGPELGIDLRRAV